MNRRLLQIFAIPALVAAASFVGLLSALLGDGLWDALSWLALGLPVALADCCGLPWVRAGARKDGRRQRKGR